ncbi:MAG: DUF6115 domain-containing protein [Christensenellales bacterium]|jgi:ElaB/YqjD/DUF883 family membrane-anchored ribosome-binding protein
MEWIYFACALFVFFLVLAVVVLNDRLKRSRYSQDEERIQDKEKRLFTLYQNLEDLINGMEEYAEESKGDIRQVRDEAAAMLTELRALGAFAAPQNTAEPSLQDTQKKEEPLKEKGTPPQAHEKVQPLKEQPENAVKKARPAAAYGIGTERTAHVRTLFERGCDIDEIAQEMSIARGEVKLILDVIKSKGEG